MKTYTGSIRPCFYDSKYKGVLENLLCVSGSLSSFVLQFTLIRSVLNKLQRNKLLSVLFVVAFCFVYRLQKPHPLRSPVTKQPSLARALTISSISENVNKPLVSKDCRNFSKAPLKLKFPLSSRGNYYKLLLITCNKLHAVCLLSLLVRIRAFLVQQI